MGFFTKTVDVIVHGGRKNMLNSTDGRYEKQMRNTKNKEKKLLKSLVLHPHSAIALRSFIEEKYAVQPLSTHDERYKEAFPRVKAYLAEEYADEYLQSWDLEERFQEAQKIPESALSLHFYVYSIPITVNSICLAWLEVYVEEAHDYLSFKTICLEDDEHYLVGQTKREIVNYFGISENDIKERTDRFIQFMGVQ